MGAQDEDAQNYDARDEIARVAAHDVRHMLSRSGLHEIVELARSVTEHSLSHEMPGPSGSSGSVGPRSGTRYPMCGE